MADNDEIMEVRLDISDEHLIVYYIKNKTEILKHEFLGERKWVEIFLCFIAFDQKYFVVCANEEHLSFGEFLNHSDIEQNKWIDLFKRVNSF